MACIVHSYSIRITAWLKPWESQNVHMEKSQVGYLITVRLFFSSLSLSLSPAPLLSRFARLPGQWMEGQRQETACRGPMVALAARARSGRLADRGRACNGALEVGRQHCSVWPLEAAALKQPGRVDRTYQQWQLWCQTYFMHLYSSCRK